jgi:hypothetical protein
VEEVRKEQAQEPQMCQWWKSVSYKTQRTT